MIAIALVFFLQIGGSAGINGFPTNAPTISSLAQSTDASTVVLSWTTSIASDSRGKCGTEQAVDNGVAQASTSHQIVVAGLAASTTYTCTVNSGTTYQSISATTTAVAATTPITGLSFGEESSAPAITGDTYPDCQSDDGSVYMMTGDTHGSNGGPIDQTSALAANKITSQSPMAIDVVNQFTGYGICCTTDTPDGLSPKGQGLFCMNGKLFVTLSRTKEGPCCYQHQYAGSIILSNDHGATWNNMQMPNTYYANGQEMTPPSISFSIISEPFNFTTNTFLNYGADDGSLGYTVAANRHDNGNGYVYMDSVGSQNGGEWGSSWDNNDDIYLVRIPRAKLNRLNTTDYQFWVSGDMNLDSSWTYNQADATAIIHAPGKISQPNTAYIPALNRYLKMTFYYPNRVCCNDTHNSVWLSYEAPHPNGPWTLIDTQTFTVNGEYNPSMLADTVLSAGTSPTNITIVYSYDFQGSQNHLFYRTMTVAH